MLKLIPDVSYQKIVNCTYGSWDSTALDESAQ